MLDLTSIQPFLPYIIITALTWFTYAYTLKCGFVIDDIAGIVGYDGKLQGFEYGMIFRWLRYHICGGNFPSGVKIKQASGSDVELPQGKVAWRHHLLSLIVFNISVVCLYKFISPVLGTKLSLLTLCLFIVHPVVTQGVAWISGIGYPLSLIWMSLAGISVQSIFHNPSTEKTIVCTLLFCLFQFLSIHAQFATMMFWVILLILGYWKFALLGFIISALMGLDIIRQTISFRKDEFKKQKMEGSTFLKPRKILVALKTLAYYFFHVICPRKMGLYHEYGFHYDKEIEREDWRSLLGFIILASLITAIFFVPLVVKLGIIWFIAFSIIFWNWITIQQFLTERYVLLASFGFCLIVSYYTQNYPVIYTAFFIAYLVRTLVHLPTYDNLIKYYHSNIWNFEKSEVAYGNLGVAYMEAGLPGMAMDCWKVSSVINPDYDVPLYNLFSQQKTQAMTLVQNGDYFNGFKMLQQSLPMLDRVIACKVCHFPDQWKEEQKNLRILISDPKLFFNNELKRLDELIIKLSSMMVEQGSDENRKNEISISLQNANTQKANLKTFIESNHLEINPA